MSSDEVKGANSPEVLDDARRREALVKLGKYAAYVPPMMIVTMSAAQAVSASVNPV